MHRDKPLRASEIGEECGKKGFREGFRGEIPEGFRGEIPEAFRGEIPEGFREGFPECFPECFPEGFRGAQAFPGGFPEGFPRGFPRGFRRGLRDESDRPYRMRRLLSERVLKSAKECKRVQNNLLTKVQILKYTIIRGVAGTLPGCVRTSIFPFASTGWSLRLLEPPRVPENCGVEALPGAGVLARGLVH